MIFGKFVSGWKQNSALFFMPTSVVAQPHSALPGREGSPKYILYLSGKAKQHGCGADFLPGITSSNVLEIRHLVFHHCFEPGKYGQQKENFPVSVLCPLGSHPAPCSVTPCTLVFCLNSKCFQQKPRERNMSQVFIPLALSSRSGVWDPQAGR